MSRAGLAGRVLWHDAQVAGSIADGVGQDVAEATSMRLAARTLVSPASGLPVEP